MKKAAFSVLFLAFIACGFAQDYSTVKEKAPEDLNVLFAKKKSTEDKTQIDLGWSVGLNTAYTQFDKKDVWLLGVNLGVILNHNWTLGIKAQGIVNSGHLDYMIDSTEASLVGGYGGFLLQYTLFPRSVVHVTFPLMVGGGYMGYLTNYGNNWENNYHHDFWSTNHEILDYDIFFFVEPGMQAEVNLVKFIRFAIGFSYRYSPNFDLWDPNTFSYEKTYMNGFNVTAGLKFGIF